jgi:hypothetical protein
MSDKKFRTLIYLISKKTIDFIVKEEGASELEAILSFYKSEVYDLLSQEETKYWWLSPEILYEEYVICKGEVKDV